MGIIQREKANHLLRLPPGTPWPDAFEVQSLALLQAYQGEDPPPTAVRVVAAALLASCKSELEATGRIFQRPAYRMALRTFEGTIAPSASGGITCEYGTKDDGFIDVPASVEFEKRPFIYREDFAAWLLNESIEPSPITRAWLGLPSTVPTTPSTPQPKRRQRDLLSPLIRAAQRECQDQSPPTIFSMLRTWATTKPPRPPLLGVTDAGIQWIDANDRPNELTIKKLRDRLQPPRPKTA